MVVWLIGLAGAGKTTIGKSLYKKMKECSPETVFLDGDSFRDVMGDDLGHSIKDREKNGWRICKMCRLLDSQGINVVVCILSNYPEHREWNRRVFSRYVEVFIDTPMALLIERDQKGLYSGLRNGKTKGVVGLDIPFMKPENPDLTITSTCQSDISQYVEDILSVINMKTKNKISTYAK